MASYSSTLSNMRIIELKEILKQHQLKVTGKKSELVQRILDNNIHVQDNDLVLPSRTVIMNTTTKQITKPATKPTTKSTTKSTTKQITKPATKPTTKSATKSTTTPTSKTPQVKRTKLPSEEQQKQTNDETVRTDLIKRISSSSMNTKSTQRLIGLLKYNSKTLNINADDDIDFFELAALALQINTRINSINIDTSNIAGLNLIINSINTHPSCTNLNLTLITIDQTIISNCAHLLTVNKSLRSFSMVVPFYYKSNIELSADNTYQELAYALERNSVLEKFTLLLLPIIDGTAFANAIKNNNVLQKISLYHNFNGDTWIALGNAFKKNTTLVKLKLSYFDGNPMTFHRIWLDLQNENLPIYDCGSVVPFLRQLAYNNTLRILDIDVIASADRIMMEDNAVTCSSSSIEDIERAFQHNGSIVKLVGNKNEAIEKALYRNRLNYLQMSKTLVYNILDDIDYTIINPDILDIEISTYIHPYHQEGYYDILNNKAKKATITWTSNESLNVIAKILQNNSSLTELLIDQIGLDTQYESSYRIFESILNSRFFKKLEKLTIHENIDKLSMNILNTIITSTTSIKVLNIQSEYQLENMDMLYDNISRNYTIRELIISLFDNNNILDTGNSISNMLRKNKVLTNLDISVNALDDDAGEQIFNSLIDNNTLLKLDISDNYLQEKSIIACARMIKSNHTLTYLDLSSNRMGYQRLLDIGEAMQENHTIKVLKMVDINKNNTNVLEYIPKKSKYLFRGKIFKLKSSGNWIYNTE